MWKALCLFLFGAISSVKKIPDCSKYTHGELPSPKILLLGRTGVGKSTLANQLLGLNPRGSEILFSVGDSADSHTLEISYKVGNWLGSGDCFTIIDTPGTSDTKGRDYKHAIEMARILKNEIKSVNVFLLLFNGHHHRFDASIIQLLKLYESIFSRDMWKHSITEVTFWKHHERDIDERKMNNNMTELRRHKLWNEKYKEELNIPVNEIPSVYIDPVYPIFSKDPNAMDKLRKDPNEMNQFKYYTAKLWEYATSFPPFYCDGRCKAPDSFFIGAPWMKTEKIIARKGDKVSLVCQIWNGLEGEASDNVTFVHNNITVYEKTTHPGTGKNKTIFTDKWGDVVKFEEKKAPGVGYFSDFRMIIESFETSMVGKLFCNNQVPSINNMVTLELKVDGRLSNWGSWSSCSKSCVGEDNVLGRKTRNRQCIPPQNGGNPCKGERVDNEVCAGEGPSSLLKFCAVNHQIRAWSKWSECSPICGDGSKFRMRTCTPGRNGGTSCPMDIETQVESCKVKDCPGCIQLGWTQWSQCSKTCLESGGKLGIRTRKRNTKESDPNNPKCISADQQATEYCSTNQCPNVSNNDKNSKGKMSPWTSWAPNDEFCAQSCVDNSRRSIQTRYRQCIQKPCARTSESRKCPGSKPCPIDCVWNQWNPWEKCSKACGPGGKKQRRRTKKKFNHQGRDCEGMAIEEADCFERICPDCQRGEWGSWGDCPQMCFGAKRQRTRAWAEPSNIGQFTGLNLDCAAQPHIYEFDDCDGQNAIYQANKNLGATLARVKDRCTYGGDPSCFAKGSIVEAETGPVTIQNLKLGQQVLTVQDNQVLFTPFLGWIHKHSQQSVTFFTLETFSYKIILSGTHVIFIKSNKNQIKESTTFADSVRIGDLLHIQENNETKWEEVLSIHTNTRKGIYAPLTGTGTILVDNVLASCYADFPYQSLADAAFFPVKVFPWLLDDQKSENEEGLRMYPRILMMLGYTSNVLQQENNEEAKQPCIIPTLIFLIFILNK